MVGPLTEGLERPGVRVFQEFGAQAPTIVRPVLQAVIVGESFQIVTKEDAGTYAGSLKVFNYPGLIAGSTVITSETKVFLNTPSGEFDITSNAGTTVGSTDVTIASTPTFTAPEKELTVNRKISLVDGTSFTSSGTDFFFIDTVSDFLSDGIKTGDVLRFVQSSGNLELLDTQVATVNTADFVVLEVVDRNKLRIDSALADEERLEYNMIRVGSTSGDVTISFRARRKDGVGKFFEARDLDEIVSLVGPAVPENPLAFGMAMALANTRQLVGGVMVQIDSTSGFQEALDFLETVESAYALVPLTKNPVVHQAFEQHVTFMSEPSIKSERIAFIGPDNPTEVEYQSSIADGNIAGATATTSLFTSATANFITNSVPVGSFIEIDTASVSIPQISAVDAFTWQIISIDSETQVTVLGVPDLDITTSDITYTVTSGEFSKIELARNAKDAAASFGNRRLFSLFPETAKTVVSKSEVTVPSYFIGASLAGLVSGVVPSQGFTNIGFAGFTGVTGSNDFFRKEDLNTIAAGGVMIIIQESPGGALQVRHQLSTDVSSIQKRELSVTKAVDYASKIMRANLKSLVGINVINTNFIENILKPAVQGVVRDMVEDNIIGPNTKITSIRQSQTQPDTVEVDVRMDVLFPVNFIDVTLLI